jgi:hypothetical protein
VEDLHQPTNVLRQIVYLALIGFAAVTLLGPILAVLGALLSLGVVVLGFAILGFLIWLPFRALVAGQRVAVENFHDLRRDLSVLVGRVLRGIVQVLTFVPRLALRILVGLIRLAFALLRLTFSGLRFFLEVGVLAATGALVGVVMGFLGGGQGHDLDVAIASNAIMGGALGSLAAIVMIIRERRERTAPRQVAMG